MDAARDSRFFLLPVGTPVHELPDEGDKKIPKIPSSTTHTDVLPQPLVGTPLSVRGKILYQIIAKIH